jgi:hypothetical protein
MERADHIKSKSDKGAAAAAESLTNVAAKLLEDAGAAKGADASRLRSLSATLTGRAEAIH